MAVWSETNVTEVNKAKRIDSEYFHPDFIAAEAKVIAQQTKPLGLLGKFLIGPFGSAFQVSNYDPNSPYRYIRGKDVKPFQLLDDDSVYMPPSDFFRLEKYAVQTDDLLISVVGTLGNVAVVPEDVQGIFSCKSTVFRDATVDPYFLLAYLNCRYGRSCLLRRQRGAIQAGLNKEDLKSIPIPQISESKQILIGNLVKCSLVKSNQSNTLYLEAQSLLEKELGFDKLVLEKPKSYETTFSEVMDSRRIDSEHFQVKYFQIKELIKN